MNAELLVEGPTVKIGWDRVRLVGVIKNSSHFKFPDEFEIAHYSGEPGVPDGKSTVYRALQRGK